MTEPISRQGISFVCIYTGLGFTLSDKWRDYIVIIFPKSVILRYFWFVVWDFFHCKKKCRGSKKVEIPCIKEHSFNFLSQRRWFTAVGSDSQAAAMAAQCGNDSIEKSLFL